jgi:hypothetical protein
MNAGIGTIRLSARVELPAAAAGAHQLVFRNTHRVDASVYLVNALIPEDDIQITGQRRDPLQHELRLDYRVASASRWTRASRTAVGLGLVAVLVAMRGRSRRPL